MRTVVVDDEPIARRFLMEELARYSSIEVVGQADRGDRAIELIRRTSPDLAFIDLGLPDRDGLSVLRELGHDAPLVVFVSACELHALEAFEAGAVDYLLKPVGPERLRISLERLQRRPANPLTVSPPPAPKKLIGKKGSDLCLLDVDKVFAIQAEGDTVWIYLSDERYLASESLNRLEGRLTGARFIRVHRNALVNLAHIRKVTGLSSQRYLITLGNLREFVVSRRKSGEIRRLLKS